MPGSRDDRDVAAVASVLNTLPDRIDSIAARAEAKPAKRAASGNRCP